MGWILAFGLFLVVLPIIGLVVRWLLTSGVITPGSGQSTTTSFGGSRGRAASVPALIPGSSEQMFQQNRDDLLTNPIYSHLPGNIFHASDASTIDTGLDHEFDDAIETGPDYITDPIYSYMPGNIYYSDSTDDPFDDDIGSSSIASTSDDDFGSHATSSSFDDDFGGSSISSSFDDDWHSSSFDD